MKESNVGKSVYSINLGNLIKSEFRVGWSDIKNSKNNELVRNAFFSIRFLNGKLFRLLYSCCALHGLNLKLIMFINTHDLIWFGGTK
jgi:hypothetical protein